MQKMQKIQNILNYGLKKKWLYIQLRPISIKKNYYSWYYFECITFLIQ